MKRIYFSIITIVFVICIVGCEKNKIDDNASLLSNYIVKTGTKSGSIIHVTNICKENGKPIKFMGVTVAVRYNYVSKTHSISRLKGVIFKTIIHILLVRIEGMNVAVSMDILMEQILIQTMTG